MDVGGGGVKNNASGASAESKEVRDVSKVGEWGVVQVWQNFQTSLVLLIPNCTHNRMITYTSCTAVQLFIMFCMQCMQIDCARIF